MCQGPGENPQLYTADLAMHKTSWPFSEGNNCGGADESPSFENDSFLLGSSNQDRNPDCIFNARVVPFSYLLGSRKWVGQAEKATVHCSGSRSQSQYFVWLNGCGKRQKREKLFCWSGWSVCNEAPGALSEQRQKTPLESFTLTGEVPILLSSPLGLMPLSGSVLLLATDQ